VSDLGLSSSVDLLFCLWAAAAEHEAQPLAFIGLGVTLQTAKGSKGQKC
jgi:hypothetical protein